MWPVQELRRHTINHLIDRTLASSGRIRDYYEGQLLGAVCAYESHHGDLSLTDGASLYPEALRLIKDLGLVRPAPPPSPAKAMTRKDAKPMTPPFARDLAEFKQQQQQRREREAERRRLERQLGLDLRAMDDVAAELGESLETYLQSKADMNVEV